MITKQGNNKEMKQERLDKANNHIDHFLTEVKEKEGSESWQWEIFELAANLFKIELMYNLKAIE